jgi:thiamine biosynthesis lipoprotein
MGTTAHVVVDGPRRLASQARRRLASLEDRWTRFRPSELTSLNARSGRWVRVSGDLYVLVARAVQAWRATRGRFDPTVLDALSAAGYDRSFELLEGRRPGRATASAPPGCAGIGLHPERSAVRLEEGVRLDPGGIGKGLAADIVSRELMEAGAGGVLLSVGGDVRVRGSAPGGRPWTVTVEHPLEPRRELARLALRDGAVATSSRVRRTWPGPAGERAHHVIDPASGRPAGAAPAGVSVVAGEGWWAEALSTSLMVAGADWRDALDPPRTPAVVVSESGRATATERMLPALR